MKLNHSKLAAKVAAVNNVRATINKIAPEIIAAFAPLVGKKIMKQAGLMEKYKPLLPQVGSGRGADIMMYRYPSDYSLCFTVKDCQMLAGCGCVYHEETFYVGDLERGGYGATVEAGTLKKMYEFTPMKCDYTNADVLTAREAVHSAKEALSACQSKLHPFGEHDNF